MHSFLRAIGFDQKCTYQEMEHLLNEVEREYTKKEAFVEEDTVVLELTREYGKGMGIKVLGTLDSYGFHRECYFPYIDGEAETSTVAMMLEKSDADPNFCGMFESQNIEIAIIYHVSNPCECAKWVRNYPGNRISRPTRMSALSVRGEILLPVCKEPVTVKVEKNVFEENCMDSNFTEAGLMDIVIDKRLRNEDILSIVETSILPHGMKCDHYQVMGTILKYEWIENRKTDREICVMNIVANSLKIRVAINKKDLNGDPEIGRRFRGIIWLQGQILFEG